MINHWLRWRVLISDPATFESYIASHCGAGPGRLMMIETSPQPWNTWERHSQGDEIVLVLEGVGTFIQEVEGELISIAVKAGDTIINPKGVWHTADVVEPIKAVYMTPCPGTEHKER
jgi:quercetin dioxygenase-like cupin family protein